VAQFEVLPFERAAEEAAQLPEPTRLTITSSPRHTPERTLEFSARIAALGHTVTPHLAARAVRDRGHLRALLEQIAASGIEDVFVIGGDNGEPAGEFSAAGELLPLIREDPHSVRTIGIAAYPEGHPLIDSDTLTQALRHKSAFADYMTTQMCFDADVLLHWLRTARAQGTELPAYIGMPGIVDRRRLLEVSMRIGVGPSLSYVRKQRGLLQLLRRPTSFADKLYDALAPQLSDPALNVDGFHYYTLNQLLDTWEWEHDMRERRGLALES
jgi:methylenetetrahydrofolate reductase (NADPH)